MNTKLLLPKDKFDDSNLDKIRQLNDDELEPIIFDLLEWLQDYNWPIADRILQILIARQSLALPYISKIFKSDDIIWKYWIMKLFIPELDPNYRILFRNDIEYLASLTAQDEDTIMVVNSAKECLDKCY